MTDMRLSKEKTNAIRKILAYWPPRADHFCDQIFGMEDPCDLFITDSVGYSRKKIELKGTDSWRWNQSIGNFTFTMENNTLIVSKFNSRRKQKSTGEFQSYKLWMYTIHNNATNTDLYFFWCEKGIAPVDFIKDSTNYKIDDFSFLKTFMSEEEAGSFGW